MRTVFAILALAMAAWLLRPETTRAADAPGDLIPSIEQSPGSAGTFYREKNYGDAAAAR